MLKKTAAIAALAGAALLGTTPALADGYYRGHDRGYGHKRVVVHKHIPYHAQRGVVVHRLVYRPVVVHRHVPARPVVVYRDHSSHDVLGGLIVGAVLGTVIASQGY